MKVPLNPNHLINRCNIYLRVEVVDLLSYGHVYTVSQKLSIL